jgi:hypothetical protein
LGLAFAALPFAGRAQFTDPFGTIDPAWIKNRYAPAGFTSVLCGGDQRLPLTLDQTGGTAARTPEFGSTFDNTQSRPRPGNITGRWTLGAQVCVSPAFNTTTARLVNSELRGHAGTTPGAGAYLILGSPTPVPPLPIRSPPPPPAAGSASAPSIPPPAPGSTSAGPPASPSTPDPPSPPRRPAPHLNFASTAPSSSPAPPSPAPIP